MTSVAIIIVSYNTRKHLQRCLRSLHEPAPALPHTIVVVDNASTDHSPETTRDRFPDVRVIDAGDNVGFARATNLGIRATDSDLVLLLNSDTEVPAGAIQTLADLVDRSPDVAAVGPRLVDRRGHVELSHGRMINPLNELGQKGRAWVLRTRVPVASRLVRRSLTTRCYPDWVSGACLLVRRSDAEAVGLLDERFFLYGEDVDFCDALRKRGRRIMFAPDVEVIHHRGQSGAHEPGRTRSLYRRSHLAFYEKHHPAWVPLLRLYLRLRGELPDSP